MSEGRVGLSPRSIVIFYVPVPHTDTMDTVTEDRTEYHLDSHRHGLSRFLRVQFTHRVSFPLHLALSISWLDHQERQGKLTRGKQASSFGQFLIYPWHIDAEILAYVMSSVSV